MKVDYSKEFEKSLKKLSGKMLDSIRRVITEVKQAENIKDITDCTKLVGYSNIYRIRIGDYRAFFTSRGEAYGKKVMTELKRIDKE